MNLPGQPDPPKMAMNSFPPYLPSSPALNILKPVCASPVLCNNLKNARSGDGHWKLCGHCKATYSIATDHGAEPRPAYSGLGAYDEVDEWENHNPGSGPGGMRASEKDNLINEVIDRWIEVENWRRETLKQPQPQQSPTASPSAHSCTISNNSTQSPEGQDRVAFMSALSSLISNSSAQSPKYQERAECILILSRIISNKSAQSPEGQDRAELPFVNSHKKSRHPYYWPSTPDLRLHRIPLLTCGCPKYIPFNDSRESKEPNEGPEETPEEKEATLPPMPPPRPMPKNRQPGEQDDQRAKRIWTVERRRDGRYVRIDGNGNEYISRFGLTVPLENAVAPKTRMSGRTKSPSPKADRRVETIKTLSKARAECFNCGTVASREWRNGPLPERNQCQSCGNSREPRSTKTESAKLADRVAEVAMGGANEPSTPSQISKRKAVGSMEELPAKRLKTTTGRDTKPSAILTKNKRKAVDSAEECQAKKSKTESLGSTKANVPSTSPSGPKIKTPTRESSNVASQTPSHPAASLANPPSSLSTSTPIKKRTPAASTIRDHAHAERIEGEEGKPHPSGGCKPCRDKGQTCRVYSKPQGTARCNNCLKQKRTCKAT